MISIRKWFYKPKRNDTSMLAQFFHADEELNQIAAELDSFDGRKDPERCTMLVNQLRQCQDKVLNTVNSMMAEAIPTHRANRDFRVKFPDDVLQDNLFGQLWFGAECLAAGSSIMNREAESSSMRPLAKAVTRSLEHLRHLLRDQALRNCGLYSERVTRMIVACDCLTVLSSLGAFSYVSAMVPVKTMKEYDIMQEVIVLFSETVQSGLIVYPEGPLNVDQFAEDMCEMFRPFQSLLYKIRELLWTLSTSELYQLERALCSSEQPIVAATTTADSPTLVRAYARADATDFIQRFYLDHPECEEFVDVLYGTRCCGGGGGGGSGSAHVSPSDATVVADDDDDDDDDRDCCCVEDDEDEEDDGVETTIADSDSQEDFIAAQNFIAMQESFSEILENVIEGKVAAAGDVDDDDDESNCGARSPRSSSGGGGGGEVSGVVGGSLPKDSGLHSESEEEAERCGGEGETPRGGSARRESATAVNCDRHAEEEEEEEEEEQETPVTIASDRARGGGGARSGCDSRNGASHEEGVGASTETTVEDSPEARLDASEPRLDPAVRAAVEGTFGDLISEETVDIVYGLFLGDAPCKRSPRARRRGNDDDDNAPHGGAADANPKSESSKIREFFPAAAAAESYGSGDTSSYNSECNDDEEIALAMQAAEISMRNAVRAKFHSSEDLIHRLFVCICGVADQLQTNYASDLRNILKWVFEINSTHPLVGAGDGYRGDDDEDAEDAADEEAVVAALLQSRLRVSRGTQSEAILSSPSQPSPSRQRSTIEEPPPWVPDDQSSCCVSCKAMFTVVRRRHHCRNCGKIFCARCSCNSVPLPKYGHTKPVRVCNRCYMYQVTPFTVD
ncbi:PREDICTED: lateral signaling target protein 2 homolog [Priapulus caudatus]|uniref:Lateral signaling target protein 2 homolog n=1 Tax=Priapulus caudatus TaxID=37621 RepID=A0ABM1EB35_PRICU|nr:PREDICTED: lateral signaling target protein 2 homolog [Priapulus caudatus]